MKEKKEKKPKSKAKKILSIIACVLVVIIIAGVAIAYPQLPHPLNYDIKGIESVGSDVTIVEEGEDFVSIKKNSDGDFKILMFTDIHLDGKNETSNITVDNLVRNIQKEKPDLVILGGDNVTSAFNNKRSHQLAEIFEKLGVYWGGVIGNHEGDNDFSISREKMVDIFSSYDHCLMRQGKKDVSGNGNYVLNILNKDDSIREAFFCLDSHDEITEEHMTEYNVEETGKTIYDGLDETQVNWYKDTLADMKEKNGDFQSIVVVHIPLPQVETNVDENTEFLYGGKLENTCEQGFDSGLFEAIKEGGSTQAVFSGHDHLNNFGIMVDDILLSYIEPSGYGSYTTKSKLGYEEKDWLQGYTKLHINEDGVFSLQLHRNSEDMK